MPVGGSVSATSLSVNAGARTRFATICAGLTMAVVILVFGSAVGYIALPAIAGLLIVIGFRTLKPSQIERVWQTGMIGRVVMIITFVCCLLIPLQHAVLIGVALALLLFVLRQSNQITVKQFIGRPDEMPLEQEPPASVPPNEITGLVIYGNVFFATASLVEEQLPEVDEETRHAVVILHLQGEEDLGSTFIEILDRYAGSLKDKQSKLILSAVSEPVEDQLNQTGIAKSVGRENIFPFTGRIGESANDAYDAAEKWLAEQPQEDDEAQDDSADASDDESA
jgi:SulP family sulfate permease